MLIYANVITLEKNAFLSYLGRRSILKSYGLVLLLLMSSCCWATEKGFISLYLHCSNVCSLRAGFFPLSYIYVENETHFFQQNILKEIAAEVFIYYWERKQLELETVIYNLSPATLIQFHFS